MRSYSPCCLWAVICLLGADAVRTVEKGKKLATDEELLGSDAEIDEISTQGVPLGPFGKVQNRQIPGKYVLIEEVNVTDNYLIEEGSAPVMLLSIGTEVSVLEVITNVTKRGRVINVPNTVKDESVRGRIESPAGWISLEDTKNAKWHYRARRLLEVGPPKNVDATNGLEFTINLALPAGERWAEVIDHFKESLEKVFENMKDEMNSVIASVGEEAGNQLLSKAFPGDIHKEICSIATKMGHDSCARAGILQVVYEIRTGCTSIGAIFPDGPKLFRTLDWEMEADLRDLTATFHFVGGAYDFTATSWAGFVGVLTGVRALTSDADGVAVSINERVVTDMAPGAHMKSFMQGVPLGGEPNGLLLRRVLGGKEFGTYEQVSSALTTQRLLAPVYFILAGVRPRAQKLVKSYAENYDVNYDAAEMKCCCSGDAECALIGKSDFEKDECPNRMRLSFSQTEPTALMENKAGCEAKPVLAACALHPEEIVVITRDDSSSPEVRRLTSITSSSGCKPIEEESKYLVQTNHDQFASIQRGVPVSPSGSSQNILETLKRKANAESYMDRMQSRFGDEGFDATEFGFNALSLTEVLSHNTVYGTVMDPSRGESKTRLSGDCQKQKVKPLTPERIQQAEAEMLTADQQCADAVQSWGTLETSRSFALSGPFKK